MWRASRKGRGRWPAPGTWRPPRPHPPKPLSCGRCTCACSCSDASPKADASCRQLADWGFCDTTDNPWMAGHCEAWVERVFTCGWHGGMIINPPTRPQPTTPATPFLSGDVWALRRRGVRAARAVVRGGRVQAVLLQHPAAPGAGGGGEEQEEEGEGEEEARRRREALPLPRSHRFRRKKKFSRFSLLYVLSCSRIVPSLSEVGESRAL